MVDDWPRLISWPSNMGDVDTLAIVNVTWPSMIHTPGVTVTSLILKTVPVVNNVPVAIIVPTITDPNCPDVGNELDGNVILPFEMISELNVLIPLNTFAFDWYAISDGFNVPSDGGISVLVIPISLSSYITVVVLPSVVDSINKRLL